MRVSEWGNSLGVRLPRATVDELGLKPGDDLEVVAAAPSRLVIALGAGCDVLLTEDLQAGRRVNGLAIVNPFV